MIRGLHNSRLTARGRKRVENCDCSKKTPLLIRGRNWGCLVVLAFGEVLVIAWAQYSYRSGLVFVLFYPVHRAVCLLLMWNCVQRESTKVLSARPAAGWKAFLSCSLLLWGQELIQLKEGTSIHYNRFKDFAYQEIIQITLLIAGQERVVSFSLSVIESSDLQCARSFKVSEKINQSTLTL